MDVKHAEGEWLAIGPAAQLLGLSTDTLRRYDRSGKLPAHRTPAGQRRFRRADVEALLTPSDPAQASAEATS